MKSFKFFAFFFAALFAAAAANAANYFESKDSCEAAYRADKVMDYKPTAKHVHFGDTRVAGMDKRGIEGDACILLSAQPGKKWVFLKQGTSVYTYGPNVRMLAECQNDIFEVVYLKKSAVAQQPAATPPATADAGTPKKKTRSGRCDWTDPISGTNIVVTDDNGNSKDACISKLTARALELGYAEVCKSNLQNKKDCVGS